MNIIFILSAARSGTTLLNQALNNHSKIKGFNELHYFAEINKNPSKILNNKTVINYSSQIISRIKRDHWAKVNRQDIELAKKILNEVNYEKINGYQLYELILNYFTEKSGKNYAVSQTGKNIFFFNELLKNYPTAKFIFFYRDPRAVLNSQKFRWKQRYHGAKNIPISVTLNNLIKYHPFTISFAWYRAYIGYINIGHIDNCLFVKYEDLIINPEKIVKIICDFLNLSYEASMLEVNLITYCIAPDNDKKGFVVENI